tara:strand:- start:1169 stop:1420 length:252 start_codon:yes stop_codon:yes gene_type:complete
MDKYSKSKNHNTFNRSSDINVSKEFVRKMEKLCLASFLSGNMDAYVVGMNTLSKLDAQANLQADLSALKSSMANLSSSLEDKE